MEKSPRRERGRVQKRLIHGQALARQSSSGAATGFQHHFAHRHRRLAHDVVPCPVDHPQPDARRRGQAAANRLIDEAGKDGQVTLGAQRRPSQHHINRDRGLVQHGQVIARTRAVQAHAERSAGERLPRRIPSGPQILDERLGDGPQTFGQQRRLDGDHARQVLRPNPQRDHGAAGGSEQHHRTSCETRFDHLPDHRRQIGDRIGGQRSVARQGDGQHAGVGEEGHALHQADHLVERRQDARDRHQDRPRVRRRRGCREADGAQPRGRHFDREVAQRHRRGLIRLAKGSRRSPPPRLPGPPRPPEGGLGRSSQPPRKGRPGGGRRRLGRRP